MASKKKVKSGLELLTPTQREAILLSDKDGGEAVYHCIISCIIAHNKAWRAALAGANNWGQSMMSHYRCVIGFLAPHITDDNLIKLLDKRLEQLEGVNFNGK